MRLLRKYRIYSCVSRKMLYQSLTLNVGVRLTHEVRFTHALRGNVLDGLCKRIHTHTRAHLRDTRVSYCAARKLALWFAKEHTQAITFTQLCKFLSL